MAGVVDRLLAQLPGLQGQPETFRKPATRSASFSSGNASAGYTQVRTSDLTPGPSLGTWSRLLLALAFGMMMASWPYSRACGFPLLGYLSAVTMVVWAGALAATAAWRYRIALAHVLSLILILYGLTLAMAEVLPRTGYAMRHATWQCGESEPPLSWTANYRLNPLIGS
jgi:hypothetical protein